MVMLHGGVWTIHLDKPDGPVIATITVQKTKDWTITKVDIPIVTRNIMIYIFTYTNPNLKKA